MVFPVVSSRLPFNFDILNEENSIMVDPDNIDEIATAIKTIKQSSLLRERLREGAIRSAKGLSINQRVNSIIDFIKQYR